MTDTTPPLPAELWALSSHPDVMPQTFRSEVQREAHVARVTEERRRELFRGRYVLVEVSPCP